MAPPLRSRQLRKDLFVTAFKNVKPIQYTEMVNVTSKSPVPNIRAITWSPTGALVATCVHAHIRIWHSDRPTVKSSIEIRKAHPKSGVAGAAGDIVEKISFCPTREGLLASTGHDGYVRLWDVRMPGGAAGSGKGTQLADCKVGDQGHFLSWHPSGTEILVGRKDDKIYSVDVRRMSAPEAVLPSVTLNATESTPTGKSVYNVMAFSNSGREVFATTQEGPVKILDYPSMSLLHTISGHTAPTYTVQHSPIGSTVAVGSGDSLVSMWDTHSWFCTHTLSAHMSSVRDLSYSFDGAYIVAGSGSDARDGSNGLEIYYAETGEVVHTVETIQPVTQVAFHPTRYWIAYNGDPGGLKIAGAGTAI